MIRVPTTKAVISRLGACAALLCIAACMAPAVAQSDLRLGAADTDFSVSLVSANEFAPHWPPDLEIRLDWPTSCLPVISRTSLDDLHIDVHLHSAISGCAPASTPVTLRVNPARESGRNRIALGIYQVRLFLEQGNGSSELIGFRLLQSGGDITLTRPENGFWWSVTASDAVPALAGSGVSIEQQGDDIAVSLLSYEAGSPVWYFGSATMPGNIARIPLIRMVGGDEPFSSPFSAPGAEPGMSLNLEFLSPSHANAWLVRPRSEESLALEIQPLSLMRVPFNDEAAGKRFLGEWVLAVEDAREARVINLTRLITADEETFRLVDRFGSVSLQCRSQQVGGHASPVFCSLMDGASVLADFDVVGLDRLSGLDANGTQVRLVRLPR
ncbi:hypothetical protein [Dokdonella sp.]|uniref:hypothetical protein n=1 Tax=Dokdonella sp. TaxID=2291710 RepID=UPI003C6735D1